MPYLAKIIATNGRAEFTLASLVAIFCTVQIDSGKVSVKMPNLEIDLRSLQTAVNAVFDHLREDVAIEKVMIDAQEDFYWECGSPERHDSTIKPTFLDVGRLSDDLDFTKLIRRGESADISYNLVHVAPLLRYIAEKVKR